MQAYKQAVLSEIFSNLRNNYTDNYDEAFYGKLKPCMKKSLMEKMFGSRLPVNPLPVNPNFLPPIRNRFALRHILYPKIFYANLIKLLGDITFLYERLNDEASKKLLIKLISYRILGYKKVKLPRNNPQYWADIERARTCQLPDGIKTAQRYTLPLLDLAALGFELKLNATPEGVAAAYIQQQYAYYGDGFVCKAEENDVVIDAGACWGDTTLYFAHEVGPLGKVYAFEFMPANMQIFQHNLEQNPHLRDRIIVMEKPLWNVSNKELYCFDHGPGSSIAEKLSGQTEYQVCKTISIDDLVDINSLKKLDFIKMDIEGAELPTLRGAENSIKRFRPKLAISVYHKPDDFITIPKYLDSLNLGYQFYLEHHTIYGLETVLFAVPR